VVSSEAKRNGLWQQHLTLNEKTQPIQWTEQSIGALVAAGSLWPYPVDRTANWCIGGCWITVAVKPGLRPGLKTQTWPTLGSTLYTLRKNQPWTPNTRTGVIWIWGSVWVAPSLLPQVPRT
jgi:hypothetical protein